MGVRPESVPRFGIERRGVWLIALNGTAAAASLESVEVEVDLMNSRTIVAFFQAAAGLVGVAVLSSVIPANVRAQSAQAQNVGNSPAMAAAELQTNSGAASSASSVTRAPALPATAAVSVPAQTDNTDLLTPAQRRTYQRASSLFASFCRDWERLLHEREVNNLEHLSWQQNGGLQTATYTGYGKVESCECHASKEGLPIGKIGYEEMLYSIAGKTVSDARHAAPKIMHEIRTLEIFSWDKGKWFY
jgi:hypothetical protein